MPTKKALILCIFALGSGATACSAGTGSSGATGGTLGSLTGGMSGVGGSGGAPATVCAANQPTCDKNRATTCNAEGTGYLVGGLKCSRDQTCFEGACENHKCMPTLVFCQALELKTCAANGLSSTSQACDVNATCTASAGTFACVCKPGYSGTGLSCAATLCGANERVQANACVACGAGTTNAAGDDASGANTSCDGPGCQGLEANCGAGVNENCCTSLTVTGGIFKRCPLCVVGMDYPATVSNFRLDKFEVTVGRFRTFVDAVVGGWMPVAGSGKHIHRKSGAGLANSDGSGDEPGWDTAWNTNLPVDKATWDGLSYLGCDAASQTWTANSGANETKPINCVNWYQSAAFCIWDGGFLPSEAEWNYAAAGGNEQRQYPWSSPASSTTIDCSYANYFGAAGGNFCVAPGTGSTSVVGSVSPKGDGLYGQADLAGNVFEWNLDWSATYAGSCNNCANLTVASARVVRGGSFVGDASALLSSFRGGGTPDARFGYVGLRCARIPG